MKLAVSATESESLPSAHILTRHKLWSNFGKKRSIGGY